MSFIALLASENATETHHWLLPETAEIIYGGISSLIVFFGLYKLAGPVAKKAMADRTARIQKELDDAAAAKTSADAEAARIRTALGDINAERATILADADKQAQAVLAEGRTRLQAEVAELEAKAVADIEAASGRQADELRAEISRITAQVVDAVLPSVLDATAQQKLVEDFISSVGAAR